MIPRDALHSLLRQRQRQGACGCGFAVGCGQPIFERQDLGEGETPQNPLETPSSLHNVTHYCYAVAHHCYPIAFILLLYHQSYAVVIILLSLELVFSIPLAATVPPGSFQFRILIVKRLFQAYPEVSIGKY
jgi:hypothetical protein